MAATVGLDRYIKDLKAMRGRSHRLTLVNAQPYAVYVHNRYGYYVFNDDHLVKGVFSEARAAIRRGVPMLSDTRQRVLRAAAQKELRFLRSVTSELRPPLRSGEGPRFAHPGHWADRRGHLVRSYWFEVDGKATGREEVPA